MNIQKKAPVKKKGKSLFSRINAWLHLWLGISSGIVVVFVALTGTIVVYCDEILDLSAGKALYAREVKAERLPAEELIKRVRTAFPTRRPPVLMTVYKDPARSVKFRMFSKERGLSLVYADPYTGEILKDDGTAHFFYVTAHLHASLLWHGPGSWIVDIASIIFLIELITGLILWWPAKWTKSSREASFKIKWKARFKRLNYDLHNVLGFYSLIIAIILTVTGLIIAFEPLAEITAKTFGGDISHGWEKKLPAFQAGKQPAELNQVIDNRFREHPGARVAQVYTFKLDSSGYYMMWVARRVGLKSAEDASFEVADRYSGEKVTIPEKNERGEKIENVIWTLHMGLWRGQLGKLITFLAGLICTSLPITGFIIWWGRGRKKKKQPGPGAAAGYPQVAAKT